MMLCEGDVVVINGKKFVVITADYTYQTVAGEGYCSTLILKELRLEYGVDKE